MIVEGERLEPRADDTLDDPAAVALAEAADGMVVELDEHLPERTQVLVGHRGEHLVFRPLEIELEDVDRVHPDALQQRAQRQRRHVVAGRAVLDHVDVILQQRAALVLLAFVEGEHAVHGGDRAGHVHEPSRVGALERAQRRGVLPRRIHAEGANAVAAHEADGKVRLVAAGAVDHHRVGRQLGTIDEIRRHEDQPPTARLAKTHLFRHLATDGGRGPADDHPTLPFSRMCATAAVKLAFR